MAKVFIPASLWSSTAGVRIIELPGETVRDVVLGLEALYPSLIGRLRDGDSLRPGLVVAVDTTVSPRGLKQVLTPENEVHFLTTLAGG
jgi:molybdopterin converting factor small subunit